MGYTTQAILAAPILSPGGHTYGCVELLNPRGGQFRDWHMEAAQTIAGTLADLLTVTHFLTHRFYGSSKNKSFVSWKPPRIRV